jgi:hypothetical protein
MRRDKKLFLRDLFDLFCTFAVFGRATCLFLGGTATLAELNILPDDAILY